MKKLFYILFITLCISQIASANDKELSLLTEWFSGQYSTSEQALSDSQFIDIYLEVTPFSLKDQSDKWFYLEISFSSDKSSPYRQEVYHIYKADLGFIYLDIYSITESDNFIGTYKDRTLLDSLTIEHLQKKDNCSVYISKANDIFMGTTAGKKCPSSLRNAVYVKKDIEITHDDFFLWERGFDLRDKQVWGSQENGYIFKKLKSKK